MLQKLITSARRLNGEAVRSAIAKASSLAIKKFKSLLHSRFFNAVWRLGCHLSALVIHAALLSQVFSWTGLFLIIQATVQAYLERGSLCRACAVIAAVGGALLFAMSRTLTRLSRRF